MFSFDSLDRDFFLAFQQARTALSDFVTPLNDLPDAINSAVTSSASFSVEASMDAVFTAWKGLEHLRARLTSNSLFTRTMSVTLMANEAILATCLETLATHHSQRSVRRVDHLSTLTSALWKLIDSRADTRELTFQHDGRTYTIHLSASPRSLHTDFDKQRLVYIACLDRLCEHIGVDDSRLLRVRAWFVWSVVETLGFDSLFHGDVWLAWQYPNTRCTAVRLRKEPSLDILLPLLGHLTQSVGVADRPPSALASLALAVSPSEERQRCLFAAKWFSASFARRLKCTPAETTTNPQANKIYRSLAVLARLIGVLSSSMHWHSLTVESRTTLQSTK